MSGLEETHVPTWTPRTCGSGQSWSVMVVSQVVYAGATAQAGPHFARLGYAPASPDISVADHMLDVAIKSPPEEVEQLAMDFSG